MKLTTQDLETLIEAIDAWEREPILKTVHGTIVTAIIFGRGNAERTMKDAKEQLAIVEKKQGVRSERATLIKASLIRMKQTAAAEQIMDEATNGSRS